VARINFYLLRHDDADARLRLACRLSDQLVRQGRKVQVLAADETQARAFDQLLWTFMPESFVPHALRQEAPEDCPVVIDWDAAVFDEGTLLNLSTELPPHHQNLDSIAEFVLNNEEAKALSRRKWNSYKQQGHELQHHQL
jgi:DNA polymerase III, chi subunit